MLRVRATVLRATSATSCEPRASLRKGACNLLHEHGRSHASSTGARIRAGRGVVVDDHDLDSDPFVLRELRCIAEVEDVAGVVLDDEEDSRTAVDGPRSGEYLIGRGRSEDLAETGGIEHPATDEPGMQRLMTRAPSRDERDLPCHRSVGSQAETLVRVGADKSGVRANEPSECFVHHTFRVVEELLQRRGYACSKKSTGNPRWACAIEVALKSSWWIPFVRNAQRSRQYR